MNCKISCSFGEIVDKVTILNIKKIKAPNSNARVNIKTELELIERDNPLVKKKDKLFDLLHEINSKLWELEDNIRLKSLKKEYDEEYIKYSELIHITNDKRYKIKREINEKYNSLIKEEKIYEIDKDVVNVDDFDILQKSKDHFINGRYKECYNIIKSLMAKYKKYKKYDEFYIDLLFSCMNVCCIFNISFPYSEKIEYIMRDLENLSITDEYKEWCRLLYCLYCLENEKYPESYNYLNENNIAEPKTVINGKIVNKYNMGFFKKNEKNKTILLYSGGGIGDRYMYCRFLSIICEKYPENNIIYLCENNESWIYKKAFESYSQIKIKYFTDNDIPEFHYHCNMICLIKYLEYTYHSIPFIPVFKNIKYTPNSLCINIINDIISKRENNIKTYIFNWKGNKNNNHELKNRKMELVNARKLFDIEHTNWIITTKNITDEENEILKNYDNINYYGNVTDINDTYIDTGCIIQHVDGVISTDTSLLHLSGTMDKKTYALLTIGCEWRWTRNNSKTNWYPNMKLIRQTKFGRWDNVILELIDELRANIA